MLSGGSPNLVWSIVSQTSCYIVSFNFLCWAVQNFVFLEWNIFLGGAGSPGSSLNLVKSIVSHTNSYIVSFNFLCWAIQKFYFGEFASLEDSQILSEPLSHIHLPTLWTSNFYAKQFKSFVLGRYFWWSHLSSLRRTPKFGQNNCLTYNFLHYEFYLSLGLSFYVEQFKSFIFGRPFWGSFLP